MKPERAIQIVADQLIANAVREIEWEDIPDIGEQDFMWLMEVILIKATEPDRYNEAMTVLTKRAEAWADEMGVHYNFVCSCGHSGFSNIKVEADTLVRQHIGWHRDYLGEKI